MITKAIIQQLNTNEDNHFKVYIPLLRKANNSKEDAVLSATALSISGIINNFQIGDVVFVAFEDSSYEKPIILGKLLKNGEEDITTKIICSSLKVLEKTSLSYNTSIDTLNMQDVSNKLNNLIENEDILAQDVLYETNENKEVSNVKEGIDYAIKLAEEGGDKYDPRLLFTDEEI